MAEPFFDVTHVVKCEDGTSICQFEMDEETLKNFAAIGILHIMKTRVAKFMKEQDLPPVTRKRKSRKSSIAVKTKKVAAKKIPRRKRK